MKIKGIAKSEKEIEREILQYLHLVKWQAWKQNNGAYQVGNRFVRSFIDHQGKSIKGLPDIAGYTPLGTAFYIEVKRPGKYPTKEQKNFILNAEEAGCLAFVARGVGDVEERIKQWRLQHK